MGAEELPRGGRDLRPCIRNVIQCCRQAKAKGQPIRVYFYEREGARWIQGIAQDAAQPLVTIHHVESEQALPQLPAEAAGE